MLISLTRKEPTPDGTINPSTCSTTPGVLNRNVLVTKKISTHNKLPHKPTFGEKLPANMPSAAVISSTPIIADVALTLKMEYIQLMSGLFFTSPAMPLLSVGVNLKAPIHSSINAIPKLDKINAMLLSLSHLENFNTFI